MRLLLSLVCLVAAAAGAPSPVPEMCGYNSCPVTDNKILNVHLVPHTHDDVGWLKTVDQYYYGSRNGIQKAGVQYILDSVVKELWEDPKRRFIYVETAFFWKWWSRQPENVRRKVSALVRQGRLQFAGGAWSMNDEAAAHYQSTVDQFAWGLRKLNETFGPCATPLVGWQIDPFGHSREFASLLAAMEYDGLFLGRIDYQDKKNRLEKQTMEMMWRGDDDLGKDSDIFTGVLYNTYSPPQNFCFDILCDDEPMIDDPNSPLFNIDQKVTEFIRYVTRQEDSYLTRNVLITMGGDFTYQDAGMWYSNLDKLIEYTNLKAARQGLDVRLFYSTPACYLKAVRDANPTLPTKRDDFFPYASDPNAYWTGYFTSRPTTKFFEREGNSYLQMAKQLQVLAGLPEHNLYMINELRSAMGVMQHHDAITGTEKEHVTHDYERMLDQAIVDSLLVPRQAVTKSLQGSALQPPLLELSRCRLNESSCPASENNHQFIVTVYNHLAWHVNDSIRIPVTAGNYDVYAPNGESIVSQIVDIPKAVLDIPTRVSKATHEIIFIAHLHPVSYKTYYVKKKAIRTKHEAYGPRHKDVYNTRINDGTGYHDRDPIRAKNVGYILSTNEKDATFNYKVNDYWEKLREQTYIDLKSAENEPLYKKSHLSGKPYMEPASIPAVPILNNDLGKSQNDDYKTSKDADIDVVKDSNRNGDNGKVESVRHSGDFDGKTARAQHSGIFGGREEMGMLSDQPSVVTQAPEDVLLQFRGMSLRTDTTGRLSVVTMSDGTEVKLDAKLYFYPGALGDNTKYETRSSGAYIFRPNATTPYMLGYNMTQGPTGPVVKELRFTTGDNAAMSVRMYDGLNFLETDWVVGPISVNDNVGKEYIVRYTTDLTTNGEFETDSNGRQMLKRKLNYRPDWNLTVVEPVAANYYPVTNRISIKDDATKLTVLTDRSEGGSSLQEGQLELMLHRRLLHDDAFGVGEALNETAEGIGLVVRGRHRLLITSAGNGEDNVEVKKQTLQLHLQPRVFISDASHVSFDKWMNLTKAFSWVHELPSGLHLLTVEPWRWRTLLLRLENYLEISDRPQTTIEIDLRSIFKTLEVISFKETNLAGNKWKGDGARAQWETEKKERESMEKREVEKRDVEESSTARAEEDEFKVKLKAKQIRTFVVQYKLLSRD